MRKIRVYDPPAGCTMGLSDAVRARREAFDRAIEDLKSAGADIIRYNLGWDMGEFAENPSVRERLDADGVKVLPLIAVDGDIVSVGEYPGPETLRALISRPPENPSG